MSGYLAGKVWRSNLPGTLKPLAACLADFANDNGDGVYPSAGYLMWLLDWGETSVRQGMSNLKKMGVLEPVANEMGGRGKIPVYKFIEELLPARSPYKGSKNNTLSVKGSNSEVERVQIPRLKGSNSDDAYKEDPLVEPSVLTLSPPSSERDDLKTSKKKVPDPRHQPFRKLLEKLWEHLNPGKPAPQWTVKDAAQLGLFLRNWPTITIDQFGPWLTNYSQSLNINPSLLPHQFLSRLHEHADGPLNTYGKKAQEDTHV